jgi:putative hydrolase of the HAD superfamily
MVKAILFDLDNTLLDFMYFKKETARAAARAMVKQGFPATEKEVYNRIFQVYDKKGIEYQKTFYEVVHPYHLEINKAEKIQHIGIIAYMRRKSQVLKPYPGVVKILAKLRKKGFKLGIVSDAPRNKVWDRLIMSGLEDKFDVVVSVSDTLRFKPHPSSFKLALKKLKLNPEEVLFVGDNPARDIKGAKKLGMKTCFAKYGNITGIKGKSDYEINKFEDLLKVMK